MKNKLFRSVALCFLLGLFVAPQLVLAAVSFNQSISQQDQQTFDQILSPVMKIYNFVKYIASAIAGVALLFAGITYMTSGADPRKRDTAKGMAMYVIIGLVIIWAAPLVVQFLVA